ncbi:MATE family efflux transporter [Methylosinus sp. RM1]|uniref:MATE family efflux transporter n=1 Tax=Methylosinus sp. RM1 TaxID=2583817 RepID=UPI001A9C601E
MQIILLSWPLILTNFAYVALTTIDIVVLGTLGAKDVAAGGLAIALFNQFRTTGTGLVTGVSNLVAEANSRGDEVAVQDLFKAGLFWATVAGLTFVFVFLLLDRPLTWLGQDPFVVAQAMDYLRIGALGLLPCLWFQTLRHFTVGLKRPGPLLMITIVSIGLTMGLNYGFVYGRFGLPALGFVGVAVTTTIVFYLSFLMFVGVIGKDRMLSAHMRLRWSLPSAGAIASVWRMGLPIAGTYASEAGFFSVVTLLIGSMGVQALAAQTVINQIVYIVFMISAGISHSASVHISEACGVTEFSRARRLGYLGLGIGVLMMCIIGVVFMMVPERIALVFISADMAQDGNTVALIIAGLSIAAVLQIFDAGQNIGGGILRGAGDTAGPFQISLIGYWLVGLPSAYALGVSAGYGVYGVWIGLTIGLAATTLLLVILFEKRVAELMNRTCCNANVQAS